MYYVYILANKRYGTLYVGVTNNLIRRVWEHKKKIVKGFTQKYGVNQLMYFEVADNIEAAIFREKQIKNWHRQWKINQIQKTNPQWRDLYEDICN